MATPQFQVIDFTDQVRKNAASSLSGFQDVTRGLVDRKKMQLNQSRKLMSDLDAVISEVDDMHKESVSEKILEARDKLARNIYKKKGKSGVRLNLQDLNSEDFNYAREMRSLKNTAANSRLAKGILEEYQKSMPNDKYLRSPQDRTEATAAIVNYLGNIDNFNQSPGQLRMAVSDIIKPYRDNVGEAVDLYMANQKRTSGLSLDRDEQGNLIATTTTFFKSLSNEDGFDENKIDQVAESYVQSGNITYADKDAFKQQIKERAALVQTQKVQTTALQEDATQALADARRSTIAANERAVNDDEVLRDKITNSVRLISLGTGQQQLDILKNTKDIQDARYFNTKDDFIEYMINRDRTNPPAGPDGNVLWKKGEAPSFTDVKNKRAETGIRGNITEGSQKNAKIYDYYGKIYDDAGGNTTSLVFFDYKDEGRNYSLIDRKNQEVIQQAILSISPNQVKALKDNPFGLQNTPLDPEGGGDLTDALPNQEGDNQQSNTGSGTFGKYSKNN